MIATLARYRDLAKMALQSILTGAALVLFLHYFLPFAEHPRILNTIGLMMDIVGVTWIAYDIFPFNGVEEYGAEDTARSGIETPEYKEFKRRHVSMGLHIVVIGFFLQILAYWVEELKAFLM